MSLPSCRLGLEGPVTFEGKLGKGFEGSEEQASGGKGNEKCTKVGAENKKLRI